MRFTEMGFIPDPRHPTLSIVKAARLEAYLGTASRAKGMLNVGWSVAEAVMGGEELPNATGRRVHARLKAVGAPDIVTESVGRRVLPAHRTKVSAPRHGLAGADMKGLKRPAKERLAKGKPRTASALERTGLLHKELRQGGDHHHRLQKRPVRARQREERGGPRRRVGEDPRAFRRGVRRHPGGVGAAAEREFLKF